MGVGPDGTNVRVEENIYLVTRTEESFKINVDGWPWSLQLPDDCDLFRLC